MAPGRPEVNTTGRCHLLELPGELRNTIIEFSLTDGREPDARWMNAYRFSEFFQPSLSYTNRQLRFETLGLYYKKKFRIDLETLQTPFKRAKRWVMAVESYLAQIKRLDLYLCVCDGVYISVHRAKASVQLQLPSPHAMKWCLYEQRIKEFADELDHVFPKGFNQDDFGVEEYVKLMEIIWMLVVEGRP